MSQSPSGTSKPITSWSVHDFLIGIVPGSIALLLIILFLPSNLLDIDSLLRSTSDSGLFGLIPILFFAIVSYLLGHIVDIFSNYFPFQATLSKLFFFSPLTPDPYIDLSDLTEEAQQRFIWASHGLFLKMEQYLILQDIQRLNLLRHTCCAREKENFRCIKICRQYLDNWRSFLFQQRWSLV